MKSLNVIGVCAAALTISACASNHGTQTVNDFSRFMQLEEGETTKADVFGLR